jgi:hypothetical protein
MADITPVPTNPLSYRPDVIVKWETLTTTNRNGTAIYIGGTAGLTTQVTGTFGASAKITWQGSFDGGATYFTLLDKNNSAAEQTAAGAVFLRDKPVLLRPALTSGDGSTDVDAFLHINRCL